MAGVGILAVVVLVASVLISVSQLGGAIERRESALLLQAASANAQGFFPALTAERDASLRFHAVPTSENRRELDRRRSEVDVARQETVDRAGGLVASLPPQVRDATLRYGRALAALPETRAQVDDPRNDLMTVYRAFLPLSETLHTSAHTLSLVAGDADIAARQGWAADTLQASELLSRANALLAGALLRGSPTEDEFAEYVHATGAYRDILDRVSILLGPAEQGDVERVFASPHWQVVESASDSLPVGSALVGDGDADDRVGVAGTAIDPVALQASAQWVAVQIADVSLRMVRDAGAAQVARTTEVLTEVIVIDSVVFVALIVAALTVLLIASSLVSRLARLRHQTLDVAENRLPAIVERLGQGDRVDLATELPDLEFGGDEIGQVASAFNFAQSTAVQVALDQSETRAGFNAAFLNVARRSQTILAQQMELLDQIQRHESDPDQIELIFKLDHLVTRERRNAENLIILGGEPPRRRWRVPVSLREVVGGAVGEAQEYKRVSIGELPPVLVVGPAVGDAVHLLAELIDNATAFSPPGAPIEVYGSVVGRGVVVQVEDRGLGMDDGQLAQHNELLQQPPRFSLFALSEDSRMGLFVVAWLARKHGIVVNLRHSAYGGVLAGVLIPSALVSGNEPVADVHVTDDSTGEWAVPSQRDPDARFGTGTRSPTHDRPTTYQRSDGPGPTATETPTHTRRGGDPQPAPPHERETSADLPRRRRHSHMDARLRTSPTTEHTPGPRHGAPAYSPDVARDRMAALQRGTATARAEFDHDEEEPSDPR